MSSNSNAIQQLQQLIALTPSFASNPVTAPTPAALPANQRTTLSAQVPPSPATLTFVTYRNHTTHRAVTAIPQSYEDATVAASRLLGSYLTDPRPDNLALRCSIKGRTGKRTWADIDPLNWELVVGRYSKVLVLEKISKEVVCDLCPLHGKLHLAVAMKHDVYLHPPFLDLNWRLLSVPSTGEVVGHLTIDRPMNFNEAVAYVKAFARDNMHIFHSRSCHETKFLLNKILGTDNSRFSFFYFDSAKDHMKSRMRYQTRDCGTAFPLTANSNPEVWKKVVPLPGGVLGVAFQWK